MSVQSVLGDLRDILKYSTGLSPFTMTQLTATQSKCYRLLEEWHDMYEVWGAIATTTLPRGPRITFLSGHGRDSITWGRQTRKTAEAQEKLLIDGIQEILQGFALEQASSLRDAGITVAYSGAISSLSELPFAIHLLPLNEKESVLKTVRSLARVWNWHEPLEALPEVAPDQYAEVRAGRVAVLQMAGLPA